MAKIDITRTELVWPGKYNEDGSLKEVPRVSLPFQVIETVNESRATRETEKTKGMSLFDTYEGKEGDTFETGWRNKLIWGDNLLVMGSLLEKFAGRIDLIYIDPPFATGADFSFTTEIGESGQEITKEQSSIEEKAYRDTWGRGGASFLEMMCARLTLMRDLLSERGSIYVHLDTRMAPAVRFLLQDLFGAQSFQNEVVWHYKRWPTPAREFQQMHDTLLCFVKKKGHHIFNPQFGERTEETKRRWKGKRIVAAHDEGGNRVPSDYGDSESPGAPMDDVWDLSIIAPVAHERTGYATQKPEALLERIVVGGSVSGSLVADFFCGSGTTLAVAEKLGRRWIGCDLGRWGAHVTRKRLLGIENCKPFEVLNLGKYERRYWQGVTFGEAKDKPLAEQALYDYLAFILKLYGAQPVAGMAHLHGKKGKAMIHIGAVDAPVTIGEIDAAVDECAKLKQGELHVLGWEWEMGLYDLMVEAAKKRGVKLLLLQIPREVMEQQAAAKGDVRFFELAYLEAEIKEPKKLSAQVALKDFVIPNTELIPEDVRSKVKKWSDYIDYWSVDWDFRNDTFMQGWVAYRTRKERKLPLTSDAHAYEKPGKYRILVKVIDIFGNDTSQAFDVEVK
jgi:adenine-specific DNA-methyltransferase